MMKMTTINYRVPYADTDQMGMVYYANYLTYFERLRNELIRAGGKSYRQWEEEGINLPVIEAHCDYFKPACYDDLLIITGGVAWAKRVRIRIECEVKRGEELLARGYTVHACINREGRPIRVPEEIENLPL